MNSLTQAVEALVNNEEIYNDEIIIDESEVQKKLMHLVKNKSTKYIFSFADKHKHIGNINNLLVECSAETGSFETLKYVLKLNADIYKKLSIKKNYSLLSSIQFSRFLILQKCYKLAFLNGHLECADYILDKLNHHSYRMINAGKYIVSKGYIDILKRFHETRDLDFTWDDRLCEAAVMYGQLECLKYLHESGYAWTSHIYIACAQFDKVECAEYIYKNGCPWHPQLCRISAQFGSINVLKFAHLNGCPINISTFGYATYSGNYDCLVYSYNNFNDFDKIINNWDIFVADHYKYPSLIKNISNSAKNKCYNIDGRAKCLKFLKEKLNINS